MNLQNISVEEKRKPGKFASIILQKKVHPILVGVLFYVCLCFGNWYFMRRIWAYVLYVGGYNATAMALFGNDIVAFLFSGIVAYVVFVFARMIAFRSLRGISGLNARDLAYSLQIFYGFGYFIYGLFSIIYFFFPPLSLYGDAIMRFLIMGAFVTFFVAFEMKYRVPSVLTSKMITSFCGTYVIINLLNSLLDLVAYVGGIV